MPVFPSPNALQKQARLIMAVVSGLLMAGLFVGDLFTPLGFAHGVL